MKKVALLLLLPMLLFAGGQKDAGSMKGDETMKAASRLFVNIGSGGTAGTYFPLGGGIADIWNRNIDGMNASVQSTGASVANINLLKGEKVEVIFVQNDTAYYAQKGEEMFADNAFPGLRGLLTMYPETVQIITLEETGIREVADLRGKRVAVGAPGSGTEANARQILQTAGLSYDDISPQYLSFAEAASNLKDRNVDAGFITAGFPTAAVQDISSQHQVVLVNISDEVAMKLEQAYPFYVRATVPAGTYSGFNQDANTVSVMAMLAVSEKLDNELVQQMLTSLFNNRDRLVAAHKKGEMITRESALDGMSIPLHPGAKMFFDR